MVTAQCIVHSRKVRNALDELRMQLQFVQSSLVVAAQALKLQDVEQDGDVANVLEFDASARLDRQIESTSALIDLLEAPRSADADREIDEPVEFTRIHAQ